MSLKQLRASLKQLKGNDKAESETNREGDRGPVWVCFLRGVKV